MNKTLLLIIVDFLFLNLIALTRWEKSESVRPQTPTPSSITVNAPTNREQDLVETMRQSLADEQTARQELAKKLSEADQTLAAREQSLTTIEAERQKLSQSLGETQRSAAELNRQVQSARQEESLTRDQLAQLQRDLAEKNAEAERQRQELAQLQKEQATAHRQIEGLTMAVVVGEAEKQHLKEQTTQLQTQVQSERSERLKVEASAAQLSQGVGQLAQQSTQLTKEIRENRPVNINVLYNDFLANQVQTTFTAMRKGVFNQDVNRSKQTPTVLVTDGHKTYAVLHIEDTVFSLWNPNYDWLKMGIQFERPSGYQTAAPEIDFLFDARVVAVPVDADQAKSLGVRVYPIAADPFKFPDAVLVSAARKGYGEVGFKLDPAQPGYVRVDNRFFKRLFGDFAPSRGDLVFSHTGEFLGLMVNNTYCALIKDFTPLETIKTGNVSSEHTGALLDGLAARIRGLPLQLQ